MKLFASKPQLRIAALLLFGLAPTLLWAASQTTYKWIDQNGRVTYGDHPPLGVKAEEIRISTGTSSASESAPDEAGTAEATESEPRQDNKPASTPPASGPSPEEAQRLCEQARSNLEILQDHALIRQTDADGNVLILDESQKQEQINTARTIISQYCK
jgi:hypothetical protein